MKLVVVFLLAAVINLHATAAEDILQPLVQLEGMKYTKARAKIVAAGWRPDYHPVIQEWEKRLQKHYPELQACASDRPVCSMQFVRKNGACLKAIVIGESPEEYRLQHLSHECDNRWPPATLER
jgi:hypothetical protein